MHNNLLNPFGDTAKGLAKNPLGIIALFIVLIYGLASLVTTFANGLTASEKLPLIWFLVIFPIIVLIVFAWLVSKHSGKLFAPSDFRNEENYVKLQLTAVASLVAASAKSGNPISEAELARIVETVLFTLPNVKSAGSRREQILWVDDQPNNNVHTRQAFEAIGIHVTTALSTAEALSILQNRRFSVVISDMRRKEGEREGILLLEKMRSRGDLTPFFISSSSVTPENQHEILNHGVQGATNNPEELFRMVMKSLLVNVNL